MRLLWLLQNSPEISWANFSSIALQLCTSFEQAATVLSVAKFAKRLPPAWAMSKHVCCKHERWTESSRTKNSLCRHTPIDYLHDTPKKYHNILKWLKYTKIRSCTSNNAISFVTADFPAPQLQTLAAVRASSWWPSGLASNQNLVKHTSSSSSCME